MSGVFLDVLEINIVVSVIFLILFFISGKLRKRYGAGWLKLVWVLLAIRLLIPYNFSLPDAQIRLFTLPDGGQEQGISAQGENSAGDSMLPGQVLNGEGSGLEEGAYGNTEANIEVKADVAGSGMLLEDGVLSEGQVHLPEPSAGNSEIGESEVTQTLTEGTAWVDRLFSEDTLAWVWIAGVGICVLLYVGSYLCFRLGWRGNLRPITDIELRKQVLGLERKLNGRANIPVYQSRRAKSPMLAGFFTPKLILPADKRKWTETELELVVAHELCHYRNRDLWLKLLMTMAWCVNWFNPLVWVLKKQFFYELELACDGGVLAGYDTERREIYARTMLSFAGKKGHATAFSTGFGESKKQMKRRIDYMLDSKAKKKGIIGIAMTCILVLGMGFMVSCGNKPEEEGSLGKQGTTQGETADLSGQGEDMDSSSKETVGEEPESSKVQTIPYDPNNEYNEMIRYYGEDVLISREDGIYRLLEDGESEELLYANDYNLKRGMEIYQDFLYFCGSARRGEQDASTVYRMDLNSYEVEDALALFSQVFEGLYNVTVYEEKLYVTNVTYIRIGFELDENGDITRMLNDEAEDFLYKADNEYWKLQLKIWNNEVEFDSEEYWDTVNQMSDMYRNVIDTAACEKMLNGDQVVLKYKDELLTGVYLKKKDGEYEFLCDTIGYPVLVTETGVYYFPDESFAVWYVDYETKTQQKIWEKDDRKRWEIQLVNYDQEFVYLIASQRIGRDQGNGNVYESYLMRVPRWTEGKAEKVYRFESDRYLGSMYRVCGIVGKRMFFNGYETIDLDPAANGMERENSGEPSEDAAAMRQGVEAFAEAYFQNDEETLRAYLSEKFEGRIDLYSYSEQADQIEGLYISGLPDGELPVGVICYVSYEFSGNAETDGALSYLSMEMEKTEQGWKILSYGLEG